MRKNYKTVILTFNDGMITYLAIGFILLMLGAIVYGFGIVMRRAPVNQELTTEQCALCLKRFSKSVLVERQIGDSKILYFCRTCVQSLAVDAGKFP